MWVKNLTKLIFSIIIFIFLIEFIFRSFLFITTKNFYSFVYGFQNIEITSHDLSNFEIFISKKDKDKIIVKTFKKKDMDKIWVFGSSNTEGKVCDQNIISWPEVMDNFSNYKIENFAKRNVFSDYSINRLRNELEKNTAPNIIFWAHKLTERRVISFGPSENRSVLQERFQDKELIKNKFFYFIKAFSKSLKKKLVSYYFFDEIALRIKIKFNLTVDSPIIASKDNDLDIIFNNFELNSEKAILLSQTYKIDFYFISLYSKQNFKTFSNIESQKYEKKYFDVVSKLKKKYDNVFLIDLTQLDILNIANIHKTQFCDDVHLTQTGTNYIAEKIYEKFINKKN